MPLPTLNLERMANLAVERTVTAVDPNPTPPQTPKNLTATARTFGVLVQWARVPGADGYILYVNDTQDFSQITNQVRVVGQDNLEKLVYTGNVAVTYYFKVASYKGSAVSDPSDVASASSSNVEVGASQTNAPGTDTFTNVEKTLLTATMTCTGRNVLILAQGRVSDPAGKAYDLKLKEDGVLVHTVTGFSTDEIESTLFKLRTPAAGSHTYTMTGTNTSDATTLTIDDLNMVVFEVPFSTSAESSTAPPEPVAPSQSAPSSGTIPTGPDVPWWRY